MIPFNRCGKVIRGSSGGIFIYRQSGSFHPKKIRIRKSMQRESFPITAIGGYPFPTAKRILFILIDEAKGVINPFPIPYNG